MEVEEEVTSGLRTVDRVDDSLSAALGNKEHTGRVRGVSVYRGWKDVFDGPAPKRRPRDKVNKDEMESRLTQLTQDYNRKIAELESRLVNQMVNINQPSENQPPISPGFRRSSKASGTEVLGDLDNLKVITICS